MVDKLEAAEMAAFGASDAACYLYPGEHQQAERAAFCEGAAHAVSTPANGEQVERPAWQDALDAQEAECRQLRKALIAIGRMIPGVMLADDVSSDFLAALPDEMAHYHLTTPTEDARERVKVLEEALEAIRDGDVPRPVTVQWRRDGKPSRLDQCKHGVTMNEDCAGCINEFVDTALGNKETDRHG